MKPRAGKALALRDQAMLEFLYGGAFVFPKSPTRVSKT